MNSLRRRIEQLEGAIKPSGGILRIADTVRPFDAERWQAYLERWWAQIKSDVTLGVTPVQRAEMDLQRDLARFQHPDDQARLIHWRDVAVRQLEHIAALEEE